MLILQTCNGIPETIESLIKKYPALFACDENGCDIDPQDMLNIPEQVSDSGYRRIWFWACEQDSHDDDGSACVAVALWGE